MIKLTVNQRHRTPINHKFKSLVVGTVFIKRGNTQPTLLVKVNDTTYRYLAEEHTFNIGDMDTQCYIVEELEIQYSLRYE